MKALTPLCLLLAFAGLPVEAAEAHDVVAPAIGEPPAVLTNFVQRVTPVPSGEGGSRHTEVLAATLVGAVVVWRARGGRHRII
jgi:hypothetical protein